jgi:uncharacterized protein DUF3667
VSHAPERTEKNCLNCGTTVIGRFCHICGQENVVPKETFGYLILHFFYDITHFDSKFFDSLKYLLFRPGFLSKEYIKGRRASYLNPIRMYVFTSAIFFLIFFLIAKPEKWIHINTNDPITKKERTKRIIELENELKKEGFDSGIVKQLQLYKDTNKVITNGDLFRIDSSNNFKSYAEYDSTQKTLSPEKRDGWLSHKAKEKFGLYSSDIDSQKKAFIGLANSFLHRLPYLLFLSLPLFALTLKLLYIRRKYYYVDHAIFSIHHYIFSFILLLLIFLLGTIQDFTKWEGFLYGVFGLLIIWPIQLYIAMLNFYKQGWFKTFIKFVLLNFLGFFILLILFTVFLFIAFIEF